MADVEVIVAVLDRGGPALWAIAALSVLTLALILWKLWRFLLIGAWSLAPAEAALASGAERPEAARNLRLGFVGEVRAVLAMPGLGEAGRREEVTRRALRHLGALRAGLRPLELIAAIAPLIGLLGTVLGMIEAFQALQESGARADASVLAGGIWEALLTTAAGMSVAIPATIAHSWFESVVERVQTDLEDLATRMFVAGGVA